MVAVSLNKTIVNACSAIFVCKGGLGAMEHSEPAALSPTSLASNHGSAGETAGIDTRQKVTAKAEPIKQAHDRAFADPAVKSVEGGAKVPPPQGGDLVVAHLRKVGGTTAIHFRKGGRVKNQK